MKILPKAITIAMLSGAAFVIPSTHAGGDYYSNGSNFNYGGVYMSTSGGYYHARPYYQKGYRRYNYPHYYRSYYRYRYPYRYRQYYYYRYRDPYSYRYYYYRYPYYYRGYYRYNNGYRHW